jgi:hypothetical protein
MRCDKRLVGWLSVPGRGHLGRARRHNQFNKEETDSKPKDKNISEEARWWLKKVISIKIKKREYNSRT